LLIVLVAVYVRPVLADPWYEHYAKAEKALEEENWTEAVVQINEALERKGDSGARVRTYGMKIIRYFPYLKLGMAYHHLGQLDAALQAFETELRLGAIQQSDDDYRELMRYRTMTREQKENRRAEEERRIQQIVRDNIERAANLEAEGRLDEAMSALGQALAVVPDHAEASTSMERLKGKVAKEQAARDLEVRVARLVEQGRSHLATDEFGEASSVLQQAYSLQPSDDIQSLLNQAQEGLRSELDMQNRQSLIAQGLTDAERLEASGQIKEALESLQAVVALDPSNQRALDIQTRLLRTQAAADEERSRSESLRELLGEAEALFNSGRFEQCLAIANRALALEPGNTSALQYVGRAYQQINQRLLGTGLENIPPAVRFADFRQELEDGSRVQRVESPDFRLSGVVIDDSPVDVVFRDSSDREIPVTSNSQALGDYTITEFNLSSRLEPGSSLFRLTATDAQSLSSSAEYAVVYNRPFTRSPWFYLASSLGLLAIVAVYFGQRARSRARLRKRRFNPYVAGAPVLDENLFFGRERLIDRVLQTIHNNSLLLYGERRIGKTSVLHHLKKRLENLQDPDYVFYPVYIDLQGVPEEKFFHTIAEDMFHELGPELKDLQSTSLSDDNYSYRDLVRDMQRVLKALRKKNDKNVRLVLLMDEVDALNEYDPKVNQRLRSLFMKSFAENLVTVVSGVEIKKHWEGEGSPWYNFFEEVEVKPFERKDAEELVERPVRGIFTLEKGVLDHIIELTEGRPYLIQKLCVSLINRLHEDNRRTVTLDDVEAVGRPEES
jgi:tetratricopeptide (TPR) repeat protein